MVASREDPNSRWRARPENRGVVNLTQEGAPHERDQHCQSAASAYDRRYGCAQAQPTHPAKPHFQLQAVRRLAQTLARYGDARRGAPISAVPYRCQSASKIGSDSNLMQFMIRVVLFPRE